MKIFLDFDETLFDTPKFKADLWSLFQQLGFLSSDIERTYKEFVGSGKEGGFVYSPQVHMKRLQENIQSEEAENVFRSKLQNFLLRDMQVYLYSDVWKFLKTFRKESMAILSFGDDMFQHQKVSRSGVEGFVDKIFITQAYKSEIIARVCGDTAKNVYFLDNTPCVIDEIKQALPYVTTILVSRPEGRYHDAKTKWCDFEVKNLDEAKEIILKTRN